MNPFTRFRHYASILYRYGIQRAHIPFLASFKLTYRCNLACRQCPFHCLQGSLPELTYPQVIELLEILQRRGNQIIVFEGGEPMLWRDRAYSIHDVVTEARKRFAAVGMTTNGTLPLDVAADVLWVSIDGFAETHERLRGAPVWDRLMENIARSTHPRLYAHLTINRQNAAEIPALLRFLAGKVRGVTLQFYYPYSGKADDLFLGFPARAVLLDKVITLKRDGIPVLNSVASLQALKANTWRCADWLVDCANPDGQVRQGCYLKGRAEQNCALCGFSPHTEASLAWRGNFGAIQAGRRIFGL